MTTNPDPKSDAVVVRELAKLAEENLAATVLNLGDGRKMVLRRSDFSVQDVTLPNAAEVLMPKRATAVVGIDTATSLIDYMNRFKNPNSMLFADADSGVIHGVIDYHKESFGSDVEARLCTHRATLELSESEEWETWTNGDERLMKHVDFATFLEENQWDVSKPTGADLLEICRDLQVKGDMSFGSSIRMGDTVQINYQKEDDVSTKNQMALPAQFEITIPVYFGEQAVRVLCFMRRNVSDGRLSLGYKMSQRVLTERREFARIVGEVQAKTGLTTVFGRASA